MNNKKKVKDTYIWFSKFYDLFRAVWLSRTIRKMEKEFISILRRKIKPTSKILELGVGTGINIGRIKDLRFKSYIGMDFSEEMLAKARKRYAGMNNVKLIKRDITKMNKEKYDIIISTMVLSHIDEPAKLINGWYDRLNKSGLMLLIFTIKLRWFYFPLYPFYKLFVMRGVSDEEINNMKGRKKVRKHKNIALVQIEK